MPRGERWRDRVGVGVAVVVAAGAAGAGVRAGAGTAGGAASAVRDVGLGAAAVPLAAGGTAELCVCALADGPGTAVFSAGLSATVAGGVSNSAEASTAAFLVGGLGRGMG